MCPTSNVQTAAVTDLQSHPASRLLAQDVPVTINTDTRTTSATTLQREFTELRKTHGWTADMEAQAQSHAANAAFR